MKANRLIRAKLLSDAYGNMSDDDRKLLFQLSQDRHDELMNAVMKTEAQTEELSRRIGKYPFASDLVANVAGNYITEGISWVFKRLLASAGH